MASDARRRLYQAMRTAKAEDTTQTGTGTAQTQVSQTSAAPSRARQRLLALKEKYKDETETAKSTVTGYKSTGKSQTKGETRTSRDSEVRQSYANRPETILAQAEYAKKQRDEARKDRENYTGRGSYLMYADPSVATAMNQLVNEEAAERERRYDARFNELMNRYYEAENQSKRQALESDSLMSSAYTRAREADSDKSLLWKLALESVMPTGSQEAMENRQYIADKYGVDYEETDDWGTLLDIGRQLRETRTQAEEELGQGGYDYERMSGYEEMLKDRADRELDREQNVALAKEHPVIGSVMTVLASPFQGLDYGKLGLSTWGHNDEEDLENYVPMNPYNMDVTNFVRDVRGTVSEEIEENTDWKIFGQNVASFLYDTGMSIGDSAVMIGTVGSAATLFMGASAASNQAKTIVEQGGTNRQALWSGLAAGAAETIFEKFSVDRLLAAKSVNSVRRLLTETVKQAGVEASEETFTEIANILSNAAIMGDNSDFNQTVQGYMDQGMSEDEAKKRAYLDMVGQVAWAGAGGLISGGVMGGGVNMMNYGSRSINQNGLIDDQARAAFGEQGQKVMDVVMENAAHQGMNQADAYGAFAQAYYQGSTGKEMTAIPGLTQDAQELAYHAGREDAGVTTATQSAMETDPNTGTAPLLGMTEGETEAKPSKVGLLRRGGVTERTTRGVNTPGERAVRDDVAGLVRDEYVNANLDTETADTVDAVAKALGLRVSFMDELSNPKATGEIRGNVVQIRKNTEDPLKRVFGHEITHRMQELSPTEYNAFRDIAAAERGDYVQGYQEWYWKHGVELSYEEALDETTADFAGELIRDGEVLEQFIRNHQTERNLLQRVLDAIRELVRKLPGMQKQQAQTAEARLTAALEASARQAEKETRKNKKAAQKSGTERYSIDKYYERRMSQWDGVDRGGYFKMGTTSKVLQSVGLPYQELLLDESKARMAIEKHKEITPAVLAKIPEMLENPIAISHHGGKNINVFGHLYDDAGRPIMVGIRIDCRARGPKITMVSKVRTVETRTHDFNKKLNDTNVLYLNPNKKETKNWFQAVGESIPLGGTRFGLIRSIPFDTENSNTKFAMAGNGDAAQQDGKVRYSLNPEFSREFDAWDGKSDKTFQVGTTSAALQEIGVLERNIIWRGKKISSILKKHDGMSREIIKQVPGILENPIIVLKSQQSDSRIAIFGEIYDENGAPVTAVLELLPTNKGGQLLDMNIIASAYGKNSNPAGFIRNSEVLYLDKNKKRTESWLQGLGLQLPSDTTALGSIGSISYADGGVNIQGKRIFDEHSRNSLAGTQELMREMDRIIAERGDKSDEEVQEEIHEAVERVYQQMVSDYGWIPAGERPARQVQVPRKTGENKKVSRTVRTILEAKATPEEALPDIQKLVAMGEFSYEVYSDKQAIEDAAAQIESPGGKGWPQAQRDWFDAMKQGKVSKENTTLGWVLYNNAVNSGDTKTALDVLNEMVRHQRNAAQALQATRILKKLSPETQLYNAQRSVNNLQEELTKKYGKKAPHLHIDETLAEAYLQAKTEDARDEAMQALYRDIGRQMPSRLMDKWTAWRYVMMLGNPRTHVRNIVGNAGFAPVVMMKNKVAAGLETAVDKLSGGKAFTGDRGSRSKSLTRGERDLRLAADGDYDKVVGQIMSGGKYQDYDKNRAIEHGRVIFQKGIPTKAVEKLTGHTMKYGLTETFRRANTAALELEDGFFARRHYRAALASYCKANGITAETVESGVGMEMARAYAIREAQKATYRDANAFSEKVSGLGRYKGDDEAGKALSIFVEGVLPFRKTPANILARGVEYSPIGLVKGLTWDLYQVAKGKKHTSEMLDELSAGLTGTGLLMLGFWLAGEGLIRGIGAGDDEKEREFAKLQGHQDYALELPNGMSVTLDWLAPEALPFFVGVNLQEQMANKEEGEELNMADWMTALSNISEPILEMSCLQSLNDLLSSVGYGTENGSALLSTAASAAASYLTQGLSTLLGQIERSSEAVRMTTYTEDSKWLTKDMQYALGRASARIPGLDYDQIPYIDAWGREDLSGSVVSRVLNNFLNPAYISKVDSSEMEQELQRLYDQTGDGTVFPTRAGRKITINGEEKTLTGEEYVKYATIRGQTAYGVIGNLVESSQYQDMSDEERAECVSLAYTYATAYGKTKVSDYQPDGWTAKAIYSTKQYSIPEDVYICAYQRKREIESLKDEDGDTIPNSLSLQIMEMVYSIPGLSETQRRAMFSDFGVGKSVIHYSKALVAEKLEKMRK